MDSAFLRLPFADSWEFGIDCYYRMYKNVNNINIVNV